MRHHREGLLSVHLAVLIFGFTALFSKLLSLSALDITFYRSVIACLAIALYLAYRKQTYTLDGLRDYFMVATLGVLLAAHWVTYFYAMQVSSVAIGVIALYTYPVITVFLEPLFHGEKPHRSDIIISIAVLFGIYLIVPDFSLDNTTALGIAFGVFSALMIALRNIMQRRYFSAYSASHALLYQTFVVALVLFVFHDASVSSIESDQRWLLLLLGVMFTALPHTLFAHGLLHLKAKTASLIACVQVVYATLFAAIFLSEWVSVNVIVGGVIIVSAAMYESLPKALHKQGD
ncbi:MAG: EamA family transporter [Gammaproteobacteria bacterium]|nr:MAG: EamA family transporter [Gammaproteobacteria bacterium]